MDSRRWIRSCCLNLLMNSSALWFISIDGSLFSITNFFGLASVLTAEPFGFSSSLVGGEALELLLLLRDDGEEFFISTLSLDLSLSRFNCVDCVCYISFLFIGENCRLVVRFRVWKNFGRRSKASLHKMAVVKCQNTRTPISKYSFDSQNR